MPKLWRRKGGAGPEVVTSVSFAWEDEQLGFFDLVAPFVPTLWEVQFSAVPSFDPVDYTDVVPGNLTASPIGEAPQDFTPHARIRPRWGTGPGQKIGAWFTGETLNL